MLYFNPLQGHLVMGTYVHNLLYIWKHDLNHFDAQQLHKHSGFISFC